MQKVRSLRKQSLRGQHQINILHPTSMHMHKENGAIAKMVVEGNAQKDMTYDGFFMKKKGRSWQNLLNKQCPNCDADLIDTGGGMWECPNKSTREDHFGRSCFFIAKEKVLAFLLDPEHPANRHLSFEDRTNLVDTLKRLKLVS